MTTIEPDILTPLFAEDPNAVLEVMREEHPCTYNEVMESFMISRYDDVERAFKDKAFTSKNYEWQLEPVHGRTILQMEGRDHSLHRNLIAPAFRGSELTAKFVPVIEANARELIDGFRTRGTVDLVDEFTIRFPINVIVDMLGLDKADHVRFQQWYHSIMAFLGNLTGDEDVMAQGLATKDELEAYMLPIIAQRRSNPGDDLLSTLCTAVIDGEQMTDLEIKAFVSLLLVAGGETTDKAMSNMIMNLIANPDQLAAVRADRSLIDAAFAETLRHSPPVQMIMRQPSEDVEMHGVTMPAGSVVNLRFAAANRDEREYDNPTEVDLDRQRSRTHLAFGFGEHFCLGAPLARREMYWTFKVLIDRVESMRFAEGKNDFAYHPNYFLRALKELHIEFETV